MPRFRHPISIATIALAATLGVTTATALPDKNSDREGWIKESMAGKQAGFCGPVAPKQLTGGADPDFVANQVASQWDGLDVGAAELDTALFLANALCKFPGNPDLQRRLTTLWTSYVGFYGFGPADWGDFAAVQDPARAKIAAPSRAPKDARFADVDGRTQALVAKDLLVTAYGMSFMSYAEMLDTTPKASEHLKAAFVAECVDSYSGSIGRWAICKADALALDRARYDRELAGATVDPRDRLAAKMRFVKLQRAVKVQADRFAAEAAKDGGVAKVIDALPAAAATAWAADASANAAVLAWTYQLVDDARANNKKLLAGCEDTLRPYLGAYLAARAPRTSDELKDVWKDNLGSQLANAAAICFVRNPAAQNYWSALSSGFAERWGVRTQTWHALAAEKIEFDTDRGNDPIGLPKPVVLYANATSSTSSGTIATMKPNGDAFDLTFKKETWKEPVCKLWKETNRIDGINLETGALKYRSYCAKLGTEKRSSTATPVTVAKALADGLKVGVSAAFVRNDDGSAYPTAIFADKKRTKIVGAFGVLY